MKVVVRIFLFVSPSLLLILFPMACSKDVFRFPAVDCQNEKCPEFDGKKVSILGNDGNVVKDTIIDVIPKSCAIFSPCTRYTYEAIYKDSMGNTLSKSRVSMVATGKRWKFQPDNQSEMIIQYEVENAIGNDLKDYYVNKKLKETMRFVKEENTGVIENIQEIWMHPFRSNQFNFTEVAPFPHVMLPLRIGDSWSSSLSIGQGWGDWENTTIHCEYKVTERENIKLLPRGAKSNCWVISSTATASFGISFHKFYFHEKYGFVKMEYKNYRDQTLVFQLVDVDAP